jgi:hypothetical protein
MLALRYRRVKHDREVFGPSQGKRHVTQSGTLEPIKSFGSLPGRLHRSPSSIDPILAAC